MNNVRSITSLNDYELQRIARDPAASSSKGSWHDQYKDSAVVFVGGLDSALTEGDVITVFSQYGEVLDINLPKWTQPRPPQNAALQLSQSEREQKEAQARVGKRRGFGFLLYEDQRSTVLAVDNLNGAQLLGRTLRVDHVNDYRQLEKDEATGKMKEAEERRLNAQPALEADGAEADDPATWVGSVSPTHPSIDLEDPMASYFAHQKKAGKQRSAVVQEAERKAKKTRKEERAKIREERERRRGDATKSHRPSKLADDHCSLSAERDHSRSSRHKSASPGRGEDRYHTRNPEDLDDRTAGSRSSRTDYLRNDRWQGHPLDKVLR